MVERIDSATIAGARYSSGNTSPVVALQARLDRCNRQLGDWIGCQSAKTPEGKKIIQVLETERRDLETRLARVSDAGAPGDAIKASAKANKTEPSPRSLDALGGLLDTFA